MSFMMLAICGLRTHLTQIASWGNDSNCCLWDGITCDSMSGYVISIDLSCSWLQGQLHPNNSLFQLSHLQTLNLAFNNFNGSLLSSQFGDLSKLMHLNLSCSHFAGKIPPKIAELSKLVSLDLSWNKFFLYNESLSLRLEPSTWEKLALNMTDLRELVLDNVNMSSIAPSSLSLKSLNILSLEDCKFDGPIPTSFGNLTQLTDLNLANNYFSGELSFLSNLQSLTSLDLSDNYFSGLLPNSIGHLKSLDFLGLHYNQFHGPIPTSFGNLTQLTNLNLAGNTFSDVFGNLSNLKSLDFSDNKLQGNFPESIFTLTYLSYLSLSSNNLSGSVNFYQFSKLQNLEYLDLSSNKFLSLTFDNNLNYTIPNLDVLHLDSCHITILPKFIGLPNLQQLHLDDNKLQGLPESIFGFLNLSRLSLSSNNLRGPISLHQFSKLQNLEYLDLSNNKFLSLSSHNDVHYTIPNLAQLDLSSCNINDFPKQLGDLQNVQRLNLSNNKIHGDIPQWFNNVGNGTLDTLDLSHNNLTSVEHLSMKNLRFLDLSFNLLLGNLPIPSFDVEFFSVSNNKFSGHVSSSFCNASSLEMLNLSHNNLSGHIPKCLVALPNLESLDLQMNNFVGSIPDNFSKGNFLQFLHLNNNQFEGQLPLSLTHCKLLEILDAGANKINDRFPNWLEGLPELQVLILRDNKFYGAIHSSNTKHPFPMLRIFDVSNNHFGGSLPTTYIKEFKGMMNVDFVSARLDYLENLYGSRYYQESVMITLKGVDLELVKIITTFTSIDLSKNMFDGEIPHVLSELHSLKGLNLSHNKITGPIPQSIANLTNLESLDLSSNLLKGEIPLELADLNFLEVLNLSQNQLVGEIPRGKQFDTFSQHSFEGNLGLCGFQLSKACNHDEGKLPQSTSSSNDKFGFGWKPVALGYGCGMVFGIFMGQVVFLTGKPKGLVRIFQARPKKQAKRTRKRAHQNQRRVN
ncbi:receptor-like protein 7 [Neltuma alba]|uniref:receptor-like protein 7 n=1 Tax=Neltuma alba TaxID=207710 RepID=UPI0010A5100C|nr:receptor-like protein 7 [Prosopis alba]